MANFTGPDLIGYKKLPDPSLPDWDFREEGVHRSQLLRLATANQCVCVWLLIEFEIDVISKSVRNEKSNSKIEIESKI